MSTLWKRDLPIAAVLLLLLLLYFGWQHVSNEAALERAAAALRAGNYADARANAKEVLENGLSSDQRDHAKLLFGQANFAELDRHTSTELDGLIPYSLAWLHQIETEKYFGASRALLAEQNFYRQHQFETAEKALREGEAVVPFHSALFEIRLQILILTGRWVEACEAIPVDDLQKLPQRQRRQLLSRLTLATFFPEEYIHPLDQRLGLLAAGESPNRNTPLGRWKLMIENRYAPPAAALASWYQQKGLHDLAWDTLKESQLAAERLPTAIYFEQMLLLQPESERSPDLMKHLQDLASPARWSHAQLWLNSAPDTAPEPLPWPLVADRASLLQAQQYGIATDDFLKRLDYWQIERKQEVIAATRNQEIDPQVLVDCWTEFGRADIAALFR